MIYKDKIAPNSKIRGSEDYMLVDFDTMRIVGNTLRGYSGTEFIKQ